MRAADQDLLIRSNRTLRQASLEIFDRTFAITAVLRVLATVVAVIGVLSALMALQLERARELGVLRAQGLTPREVWRLVLAETGLLGVIAGTLAVPVGIGLALVLVHVINRRAFGWSIETTVSADILLQAVGLAVAGGPGCGRVSGLAHGSDAAGSRAPRGMTGMAAMGSGAGLLVGVIAIVTALGVGLAIVMRFDTERPSPAAVGATLSVAEALGSGSTEGFERAIAPRRFAFPSDHGPHPTYRTEWWYWTGNLRASEPGGAPGDLASSSPSFAPRSRRRSDLARLPGPRATCTWPTSRYSDIEAARFHARERSARAALDLAGATADPVPRVAGELGRRISGAPGGWPVRLRAGDGDLRHRPHAVGGEAARAPRRAWALAEERRARERVLLLLAHADAGCWRGCGPGAPRFRSRASRGWTGSGARARSVPIRSAGIGSRSSSMTAASSCSIASASATEESPRRAGAPSSRPMERRARSTVTAVEVLVLDHWTSPRGGTRYPAALAASRAEREPRRRGDAASPRPGARPCRPLLGGRGPRRGHCGRPRRQWFRVRRARRLRRAGGRFRRGCATMTDEPDGTRDGRRSRRRQAEGGRNDARARRSGRTIGAGLLLLGATAWADGPTPATAPPPGPPSAERHFQEGLDAQKKKDWRRASQSYEAAVKQREAFPEAWNGLGYSLRQQGKYAEAIKAYDRALKLRPDYAEALEYLGEAYVKMGKLDDARAVLGRLEPLDKKEAAELRAAIDKAKQ